MFFQRNIISVGRGAVGIYLILRYHFDGGGVVVPANICYAAVYPVVYAGMTPVFCDVDPFSGNVTLESVRTAVSMNAGVKAVIVPHMYGNPVREISAIKLFCAEKELLLIEDCASSIGAETNVGPVGSFGDYVVYSTGYAKTIDLGIGGLVSSDLSLDGLKKIEASLPEVDSTHEAAEKEFSKKYRLWRNSNLSIIESPLRDYFLGRDFRNLFLFRCPKGMGDRILQAIESDLPREIIRRRCVCDRYDSFLTGTKSGDGELRRYVFASGAVPWRWCVLTVPEFRRSVIDLLLKDGIPVSDWYPSVVGFFQSEDRFPNARFMGRSILNFPLNLSDEAMAHIVRALVVAVRKVAR